MEDHSKQFLFSLLESASPSGYEEPAGRIWRAEAETFSDEVHVDVNGTSYARLTGSGNGPVVVVEGHIDEIGHLVTSIDDEGYVWFQPVGGWDDQIMTGQRVRIMTANGPISGAVGRRAAHTLSAEERGQASKIKDLWIDIGAANGEEARRMVQIGDPMVIEQPIVEMPNNRLVARGLDNRVGSFVALEVLRLLSENRVDADVYAVAASQEEITFLGARTSAFQLDPTVAIVFDVTHATDYPNADVRGSGKITVGAGPVLSRGSIVHPLVYQRLVAAANNQGIQFMTDAAPRGTGTDGDGYAPARGGIPTGVVSFPNRYMHSPNELLSLDDLDACARLVAAFVRELGPNPDFARV